MPAGPQHCFTITWKQALDRRIFSKKKKSDKKTWQKPNWPHIFLPGLNNNNSKQQPRKSVSNVSAIKMDYFWNVHDDARSSCKPCSVYEEKRKVWHGRSPTRRDLPPLLGRIISRATRPKQNFLFSGFLGSPRKSIPGREGAVGVRHFRHRDLFPILTAQTKIGGRIIWRQANSSDGSQWHTLCVDKWKNSLVCTFGVWTPAITPLFV